MVVALVAIAVAFWWLRARRVEAPAPPAITTGAPSLKAAPGAPGAPGEAPGSDADEITPPERQELDRVLRERSADPAH
jgi:hypothetical protein